jgi:hypothetical protein
MTQNFSSIKEITKKIEHTSDYIEKSRAKLNMLYKALDGTYYSSECKFKFYQKGKSDPIEFSLSHVNNKDFADFHLKSEINLTIGYINQKETELYNLCDLLKKTIK